MGILLRLLLSALALYLVTRFYPGVAFEPGTGLLQILLTALLLGLVNALVRPLLLLLSLPLNVLTLGLFTLVINGLMLWLVASLSPLNVAGFGAAVVGAILLSLVSWVLDGLSGMLGLDGPR
ncbi:phage holin family protein [Deinococcus lacus]|uniref:Phage holin family protein n=1 Tax=Deinococcus lacus TaxID=392561 RepID=A0ABW1Y9W4_9DEIO